MAEGLPDGGRIITCELSIAARNMAQAAFDESPFGDRIEIRMGHALKTLQGIEEEIDFAFVDADKEHYPQYYAELVEAREPRRRHPVRQHAVVGAGAGSERRRRSRDRRTEYDHRE